MLNKHWQIAGKNGVRIIVILAIATEIYLSIPDILNFDFSSLITPFALTLLLVLFEQTVSIEKNLEDLTRAVKKNPDIEEYSNTNDFVRRLNNIEKYENITVIGEFPLNDFTSMKNLIGKSGKNISIYRHLDKSFLDDIKSGIEFNNMLITKKLKVFNINELIENFIIIGKSQTDHVSDILLNFKYNRKENIIFGYYIKGDSATILSNFIFLIISNDQNRGFKYVESQDAVNYVIGQRSEYEAKINKLNGGVPKRGIKEICDCMKDVLLSTNKSLNVTHVSNRKNIELPETEHFKNWIQSNYLAAERNVKICRIFIVPHEDLEHPTLRRIMDEMKQKFDVRYCDIETLQKYEIQIKDFSIYDEEHLVYIYHEEDLGGWFMDKEDDPTAKHTTNQELIARYQRLFDAIYEKSIQYH